MTRPYHPEGEPPMKRRRRPAYRTVLLKLSGDALRGAEEHGISAATLADVCAEILGVARLGVRLGIVIGGGNFLRGTAAKALGIDRATADYMGMLATVINALALQDVLEQRGAETRVLSAIRAEEVAEPYIRRRALHHLDCGRIVIFAGGTGNPYQTTDTTAAIRAKEIGAAVLIKATKVDGVYDADPVQHKHARRYRTITGLEVIRRNLGVIDQTAVTHCMRHGLPIIVLSLYRKGNIRRAILGERVGTRIAG